MAEVVPVVLPKAGMNMVEATVVEWHHQVGERVEAGEPLLDIETDKVDMAVEAPASGTLREIRVEPDEDVPVGAVLGMIEVDGGG